MPGLIIQIAAKEYIKLNILDNVFIILTNKSLDKELVRKIITQNIHNDNDIIHYLSELSGELTLIRVHSQGKDCLSIFAFRSITSVYELFYAKTCSNDIILSDNFKNVLSILKKDEREISKEGIIDLFLFQRNYGDQTYLKNIKRLGHGESLTIDSQELSFTTKVIQKLETAQREINLEKGIDIIDDILSKYCTDIVNQSFNYINTLSGGVDSTLLQTYFRNYKNHSLSVAFDTDEFQGDVDYARSASKLLNSKHTFIKLKEVNYLNELKDAIAILGQPSTDISNSIIFNNIFIPHYDFFLTAIGADIILGLCTGKTLFEIFVEKENQTLAGINKPVTSIEGAASTNFIIARPQEVRLIKELFGMDIVNERLKNRINYVSERIECNNNHNERIFEHIEFGHIMGFFVNNLVSVFRQIGHNYNKMVGSPFITKELVEVSLLFNISECYATKSSGTKPILKRLLERKVPFYFTKKPKLGGSLPRTRFCESGPLKDYFNSHNTPDFITGKFKNIVKNPTWDNSWIVLYSIIFSVWDDIIFKNDNIEVTKNCQEFYWNMHNYATTNNLYK